MINHISQNENTKDDFSKAIKELQIGKLLRRSNISKNCGISAFEVFQGKNLFRFLNSKHKEQAVSKNTYYRFLNETSYNWSVKSLGKEYTKERIKERIELKRERKATIPKKDYASRRLVDTSDEKFQNSPGLKHWATIENLKIAAQSYAEAESIAKLEHEISVKTEAGKSAKQSVVDLEHRIKDLSEIIKYAEQYKANRSYHIGYKKAKNPDAYFRRYESQIILYGGARRMLEQAGINLKSLNVDKLKSEYQELIQQKNNLTATYKTYEKEVREMSRKLENINQYLGRNVASSISIEQQNTKRNRSL